MQNNVLNTPCKSIPLDWLKAPSEEDRASLVEFTRGALCSLSIQEDGSFAPVHVSRIQRSFKKIAAAGLYKAGLRLIQLLREAEPLRGGYWLPTPFRVVEIDDECVFIGATPNAYGLLGSARMDGLSRFLARDVADRYPRQSLEGWMDLKSQDPASVVAAFAAAHAHAEVRTSNLVGVTFLNPIPWRATGHCQFQWCDKAVGVLSTEKIAICRQQYQGRVRYFSARLLKGSVTTEAPINISISRLLFAISHYAGTPVRAISRPGSQGVKVTICERLPAEEFRLALLLTREIVRAGRSTTFLLSPKLAPVFFAKLESLGCALEIQQ